jgi:flagellar biosynthesis/type III secretory pathway M-ring protein FliF/YscJ
VTQTEHLIGFIAMATAIVAILVIGTLAAAGILRFGRRRPAAKAAPAQDREPAVNVATEPASQSRELATSTSGNPSAR